MLGVAVPDGHRLLRVVEPDDLTDGADGDWRSGSQYRICRAMSATSDRDLDPAFGGGRVRQAGGDEACRNRGPRGSR